MTWAGANAWIATLNANQDAGHNDWRLPTLNPSDTRCESGTGDDRFGFGCTGGELSHLFVTELGNTAIQSVLTQTGDTAEQIDNLVLFSNVQSYGYWSGTEWAPNPIVVWSMRTQAGFQDYGPKSNSLSAVAVRPGDVAARASTTQITDIPTGSKSSNCKKSIRRIFYRNKYLK